MQYRLPLLCANDAEAGLSIVVPGSQNAGKKVMVFLCK